MIKLNNIYNENCLNTLSKILDDTIDLTVTSPPYDDLRTYNNHISGKKTEFNGYIVFCPQKKIKSFKHFFFYN
jgi:DNA modification methylase